MLIILAFISWLFYLNVRYESILEEQQKSFKAEFNEICKELELDITQTMAFIYGLRGFVYSQIDTSLTQEIFDTYAEETQNYATNIQNFSVAPNNIQQFVFPLEGNELTIGHDLGNDERENVRRDVMAASHTESIIISGPYTLRQGELGMIVRSPIYSDGQYWGLVNVAVDLEAVLQNSAITETSEILYALSKNDTLFWRINESDTYNIEHKIRVADDLWTISGHIPNTLASAYQKLFLGTVISSLLFFALLSFFIIRIFYNNFLMSSKIKSLIYSDILTKLPNRRALEIYVEDLISKEVPFGLAFIDLDNFKDINDTLGHSIGDELLIKITKRIENGQSYKAYRWGGDEFIIIKEHVSEEVFKEDLAIIVERINLPVTLKEEEYIITCSAGLSFYPKDGDTKDEIIKLADATMYSVKDQGKNMIQVYTKEIGEYLKREIQIERLLEQALKDEALIIYYQPKYNIKTKCIDSVEALLRWQGSDGKYISPALFIPIAEKSNLIHHIDEYVVEHTIKQLHQWQLQGIDLCVAINVSASHLTENFKEMLTSTLEKHQIAPQKIELEITETAAIDNFEMAQDFIEEIGALGVSFALDDFGTGYSSLSYLSKLNISTLKIDKSFVDLMVLMPNENTIVKAVFEITKVMKIKTVAEGVEERTQLSFLEELECDYFQGYLLSKAITADELVKLLQEDTYHELLK